MTERYLVSGIQLGMLVGLSTQEERGKLVRAIIDKQCIFDNQKDVLKSCHEINQIISEKIRKVKE